MDFQFKIILIGPGSVGKTSLVDRFVHNKFSTSYKMTMGVDLLNKELEIDGYKVKLNLWDIGGQERLKYMRRNYYRGTSGALMLFDLSRSFTYEVLTKKWYSEMNKYVGYDVPFILIGNKSDLLPDIGDVIDPNEPKNFAETNESIYIQTSAKTGENVEDAFVKLTKTLVSKAQI
jgi:small GTP-binding protein